MDFITLFCILFAAWLVTCMFYLSGVDKFHRIKLLLFSRKINSSSSQLVRKVRRQIVTATILFLIAVAIAYLVSHSAR